MSPTFQSIVALSVVAVAAIGLVLRAFARRKNPGCGGDCGCATSALKVKPGQRRPAA